MLEGERHGERQTQSSKRFPERITRLGVWGSVWRLLIYHAVGYPEHASVK